MGNLLKGVELFAFALWYGSVLFFSIGVAPMLFRKMDKNDAARSVRLIFPVYYLVAIVCALALLGVCIVRGTLWGFTGMHTPGAALFILLAALAIFLRQRLTPALNAARDRGPAYVMEFQRMHRFSVLANGLTLVLLTAWLFWMAVRGY